MSTATPRPVRRKPSTLLPIALAFLLPLVAGAANGASRSYLSIPGIDGDSIAVQHEGEIDLVSWRWVIGNAAGARTGTTRVRSSVCTSLFEVVKRLDGATVPLLVGQSQGQVHPEVALSVTREDENGAAADVLKITLADAIVTSIDTGALDADGRIIERVAFAFATATLDHHGDGGSSGGTVAGADCGGGSR